MKRVARLAIAATLMTTVVLLIWTDPQWIFGISLLAAICVPIAWDIRLTRKEEEERGEQ